MTEKSMVTNIAQLPVGQFTTEQIELIKRTICNGATDDELQLFLHVCKKTQLDPFARQVYAVKRKKWNSEEKRYEFLMSIQTSIDGFRLVAERTGKYQGQTGPEWCGDDGVWKDVWLTKSYPAASRVGVMRSDFIQPLYGVATWDSYVQQYEKDGKMIVGKMWNQMPDVMLAKCAESLALRKAFPQELSGLYSGDEMSQTVKTEEDNEGESIGRPAKNAAPTQTPVNATTPQQVLTTSVKPIIRTINTVNDEIAAAAAILNLSSADLYSWAKDESGVEAAKMTLKQMEDFLGILQLEIESKRQ